MATTWYSGLVTNPSAGATIATTGTIIVGKQYEFMVLANVNVAGLLSLQRVDSGGTVQDEQEISILANDATQFGPLVINCAANDEVRVVAKAALGLLSRASASLFSTPL